METRLVWVTMLALADQYGHVDGTVKSLARVSRVTVAQCQTALDCLLGSDDLDRSGVLSGRRIIPEQGGWGLVNYATYRNKMSVEDRRERDRIRKRNARMSAPRPQVSENVREVQQAEAEADTKAKTEEQQRTSPPLISGESNPRTWGKIHGEHVTGFCDWVCLPQFLFNEFARKSGQADKPDGGAAYVGGWATTVRERWTGPIGDNLKFWRERWSESHPITKAAPKPFSVADALAREAARKAGVK